MGTVVVLDDLTELITAQKTAAWREVARRIAHEIRNPLTPIQLSAQRIARRYRRAAGAEGQFDVIEEGTRTILQEVDTLKGLVSEFSRYARMPTVSLVPSSLHDIIENGLLACASMHEGIAVDRDFSAHIPTIQADPDQLKRAFTNLFDNAVEAMEGEGTLRVATSYDTEIQTVRIEVADTGPGITPEDKDRLFLPYFSRKRDGTGLGLAIVHQIVADHSGYVRVNDNQPRGTVFTIELPC
jgi:two-component system nitrogen regulation sensor histidine kinase NtrY